MRIDYEEDYHFCLVREILVEMKQEKASMLMLLILVAILWQNLLHRWRVFWQNSSMETLLATAVDAESGYFKEVVFEHLDEKKQKTKEISFVCNLGKKETYYFSQIRWKMLRLGIRNPYKNWFVIGLIKTNTFVVLDIRYFLLELARKGY